MKSCPTCNGSGRIPREDDLIGISDRLWERCRDCHGAGVLPSNDDQEGCPLAATEGSPSPDPDPRISQCAQSCSGQVDVVFISMPWAPVDAPSIQLGILKAILDQEGIHAETAHLNLAFLEYLAALEGRRVTYRQYKWIELQAQLGLGEWTFAVPPLRENSEGDDRRYEEFIRREGRRFYPGLGDKFDGWFEQIKSIRRAVPEFLCQCADELLARQPRVVGFTCTYLQRVPSLALARLLKSRDGRLRVVFGGANCSGPMGEALLREYSWIDVVVRGEVEPVATRLFRDLVRGQAVTAQPGLCIRREDRSLLCVPECDARTDLNRSPLPVYDEYFQRLQERGGALGFERVQLPYESSRGCWWGTKRKCRFCGRDDRLLHFRSKSLQRLFEELRSLSARFGNTELMAMDNVIDMQYLRELLPRIRDAGLRLSLFYQVRPTFTKDQLRVLHAAAIRTLFAGIESLSTPLLEAMQKGTTALGNIRFLKWCAELGISADWNLMYGLAGERREHYDQMADTMQSLGHLRPPACVTRHVLCRFSRYFENHEQFGIDSVRPSPMYGHVFGPGKKSDELAYYFDFSFVDGHDPESHVEPCREAVEAWRESQSSNFGQLYYHHGPGFMRIVDQRSTTGPAAYDLDEVERQIYLACDAGASIRRVSERLRQVQGRNDVSSGRIESFLNQMVQCRVAYHENGRYLSLALSRR